MLEFFKSVYQITALEHFFEPGGYRFLIMIAIALGLAYLAIGKKKEPFLLLPLSFGILIANLPGANLSAYDPGGLLNYLYQGIRPVYPLAKPVLDMVQENPAGEMVSTVMLGDIFRKATSPLYPPLIFLCIGTITDFGPLIANPRVAWIGLGGQFGIFIAFGLALLAQKFLLGYEVLDFKAAATIGIIGSSDGPTTIYAASVLAPAILPAVAIAAFSYMGLVPFIQPPIMKLLIRDHKERTCVMPEPKQVTQRQKLIFALGLTVVTLILVPTAGALIGMLMLGSLIRESGIVSRYVDTLSNAAINFLTLMLALSIGSSARADYFLTAQTLLIVVLGLIAFAMGTVGGITVAKILYHTTGGKISPLIGNSGVSAMPMAARISQRVGQEYNHQNHLLMHAMGPIVASTIGSAIVAGIFISLLK